MKKYLSAAVAALFFLSLGGAPLTQKGRKGRRAFFRP